MTTTTADTIEAMLLQVILGPPKRHRRTMARRFTGRGRRFSVPCTPDGVTRMGRLIREGQRMHDDERRAVELRWARVLERSLVPKGGPQ